MAAKTKTKILLTDRQKELLAKYFTASNVGTMEQLVRVPATDVRRWVQAYFRQAVENHMEVGIDLEYEKKGELDSFRKNIKKDPSYWVGEFESRFGAGSVAKLNEE